MLRGNCSRGIPTYPLMAQCPMKRNAHLPTPLYGVWLLLPLSSHALTGKLHLVSREADFPHEKGEVTQQCAYGKEQEVLSSINMRYLFGNCLRSYTNAARASGSSEWHSVWRRLRGTVGCGVAIMTAGLPRRLDELELVLAIVRPPDATSQCRLAATTTRARLATTTTRSTPAGPPLRPLADCRR